jgi:hypothetical protein
MLSKNTTFAIVLILQIRNISVSNFGSIENNLYVGMRNKQDIRVNRALLLQGLSRLSRRGSMLVETGHLPLIYRPGGTECVAEHPHSVPIFAPNDIIKREANDL